MRIFGLARFCPLADFSRRSFRPGFMRGGKPSNSSSRITGFVLSTYRQTLPIRSRPFWPLNVTANRHKSRALFARAVSAKVSVFSWSRWLIIDCRARRRAALRTAPGRDLHVHPGLEFSTLSAANHRSGGLPVVIFFRASFVFSGRRARLRGSAGGGRRAWIGVRGLIVDQSHD